MRLRLASAPLLFLVVLSGCVMHRAARLPAAIPRVSGKPVDLVALRHVEIAKGIGAPMEAHKCLYVHYTGWLTNGTKFDTSLNPGPDGTPGDPISFPQGGRRVIAGWDMGFDGMKVGGKRRLLIPYQLAYGDVGRLPVVPPKSELIFDVELMAVADPVGTQCPPWATVKPTGRASSTIY